jgi:multidrug efflux pump subunit AcrB
MSGWIQWFARNHVAANLLMFGIMIAGLLSVPTIKQTIMPDFEINYVSATVVYPGASPEDVESSVTTRLEEEIQDVEGIKELVSSANEGATNLTIELDDSYDMSRALTELNSRISGVRTLPVEAERPIVSEMVWSRAVIDIALHGDADERTLTELGHRLRDELASLHGVSKVTLSAIRPYEISIEVSDAALQRYGLRFDDVMLAVRRTSVDMPGGSVKSEAGEILLRTEGQAYRGAEFAAIPLVTRDDGSRVVVGDVAKVVDGFEETTKFARFDGDPAVLIKVFRVGDQHALDVAGAVKAHVATSQASLPDGLQLTLWDDESRHLADRIGMMLRNATGGFLMVLVLLAFFLKLRVAFWVAMGVPVSVLGALALMPAFDLDINIMTLFSFIMALGILVDDAIVTGENIYTHQEREPGDPLGAAIRGTEEVATPVIFGVLTTIAAFAPFALIGGQMRFMAIGISGVMMIALGFSIIESKLVLPSHLAHASGAGTKPKRRISIAWARVQQRIAERLRDFIENRYAPAVSTCVRHRYVTAAVAFGLFFISLALIGTGHMRTVMMAPMESDSVRAHLTMPLGTPVWQTERAIRRIEESAERLRAQLAEEQRSDEPAMFRHVMSLVGSQRGGRGRAASAGQPHLGLVAAELSASEDRSLHAGEIANRWRELTGPIPGAEEIKFSGVHRHFGDPIAIELRGDDVKMLELAAARVAERLIEYPGVYDIRDSNRDGKRELKLEILPGAEALGLGLDEVGRQVRQAFYGAEAQRIQRGRDEVKVMIRYPPEERRSLADVHNMRIRLPDGTAVPFGSVASVVEDRGPSSIFRRNRYRTVTVRADLDEGSANATEILTDMEGVVLPDLLAEFPGVQFGFDGEEFERREALAGLARGSFVALLAIFTLLAIPLRSYLQPLFIMIVIPFGFVGALFGHLVTGTTLSMFSLIGVMACAGVVVNDSLVLVTFLNRLRDQGVPLQRAAVQAGQSRFRAIMLTSLTTFAGLTPVILDTSAQAQMVIPMAVSLGFGVLVATFFTLLLVPASIVIADDIKRTVTGRLPWSSGPEADDWSAVPADR